MTSVRRAARVACLAALCGCDFDMLPEAPRRPPRPPAWVAPTQPTAGNAHLAMGAPTDLSPQDELALTRPQYALSYNRFRNDPNWVAWRLTAADLGSVGRTRRGFSPDPLLPDGVYRVQHHDYSGSGFDHGHLCPSAERTATVDDNGATFLTTNILPQRHAMNAGPWEALETWSVTMARAGWDVYIVAGGAFAPACATDRAPQGNLPSPECPTVGRGPDPSRHVAVPDSMWKVLVLVPRGAGVTAVTVDTPVVAVDMPNDENPDPDWRRTLTTVDAIEQRTGYDLLNAVPISLQQRLEAQVYRGP